MSLFVIDKKNQKNETKADEMYDVVKCCKSS